MVKDRKFVLILYPDDPSHVVALDMICKSYSYACILHNRDPCDEDGVEFKKPHYHVVIRFGNARSLSAIAKELGITENYIEPCSSLDSALLYLVHYNSDDKYQYEIDDVQGPLKARLEALLADEEDEGQMVLQIVYMIDSKRHCSFRDILVESCKAGLWSQWRKLGSSVKFLIDEHNLEFEREMTRLTTEHCISAEQSIACTVAQNSDVPFYVKCECFEQSGFALDNL